MSQIIPGSTFQIIFVNDYRYLKENFKVLKSFKMNSQNWHKIFI